MFNENKIRKETRALMIPEMSRLCGKDWKKNKENVRYFNEMIEETVKLKCNPLYTEEVKISREVWAGHWPWPVDKIVLKSVEIRRLKTKTRRFIFVEIDGRTYALNGQTAEYYHIPTVSECVKITGDLSGFVMFITLNGGEGNE